MTNSMKEEEPLQCKSVSLWLCVRARDWAMANFSFILTPRIVAIHLTKRNKM